MRKFTIMMLVAFCTMLYAGAASAQQTQQPTQQTEPQDVYLMEPLVGEMLTEHQAMSADEQNILEHAKALYWQAKTRGQEMNKAIAEEHVEEIGQSLQDMDKLYAKGIERITTEEKAAIGKTTEGIRKRYTDAGVYYQALHKEISKENPSPEQVMDLSAGLYQQVEQAATARQEVWDYRMTQGGYRWPGYIPEFVAEMRNRPIRAGK